VIIATFQDDEVKVHVSKIDRGFSVAVQDVDSEEFFNQVFIYPTEEAALTAAKQAVRSEEEDAAERIARRLFPNVPTWKLTEQEKLLVQTEAVRANLESLAGSLPAGGTRRDFSTLTPVGGLHLTDHSGIL